MQEVKLIIAIIYSYYDIEIENNDFTVTLEQEGSLKSKLLTMARFISKKLDISHTKEILLKILLKILYTILSYTAPFSSINIVLVGGKQDVNYKKY
jgi:hypothetical protein